MKHEARTTLVVTAGELHDLIEALAAVEACCATAKKAYAMADNALRAQETHANAERYMRLLRRLQETEAVMAARKGKYPEAFYTWLESKYQFTAYQLWLMDEASQQSLFHEWETDFGGRGNLAEDLRGTQETTDERCARIYDERRARKAMRRTAKALCMWLGGAMFVASMFATSAGMGREALFSGAVAFAATLYGGIGWIRIVWW